MVHKYTFADLWTREYLVPEPYSADAVCLGDLDIDEDQSKLEDIYGGIGTMKIVFTRQKILIDNQEPSHRFNLCLKR